MSNKYKNYIRPDFDVKVEQKLLPLGSANRTGKKQVPEYIVIHEVSLGLGKSPENYNMEHYKNLIEYIKKPHNYISQSSDSEKLNEKKVLLAAHQGTFGGNICTNTISSNVRCILLDDTFVEPFSGVHFKSLGGVVSLGPPCGPLPRLAQPRIVKIEKGKLYEDSYIFGDLILKTERIVFGGEAKYYYVQRCNSIVNSEYNAKTIQFIDAVDRLCEIALSVDRSLEQACVRRRSHAARSTLRYMEKCKGKDLILRDQLRASVLNSAEIVLSDSNTPTRDRLAIKTLKMGYVPFYFAWRLYGFLR